jgi:nitrite reductase/ring-hydroxylating ferredoxin subunit
MSKLVRVAARSDIPPGHAKSFIVGLYEIAVFNIDGVFYAIDGTCPHQGGPLVEGWIDGTTVTCPWHAWCFDVRSGKMTLGEWSAVDRFAVRVEGDDVLVGETPLPADASDEGFAEIG